MTDKIIKFNANKLLQPYFKECLRIAMTQVSVCVSKVEDNRHDDDFVKSLYFSSVDVTIIFKAITGIENCNMDLLINSLKSIANFSKTISLYDSDKGTDDIKFEFYKLVINTERVIEILESEKYDPMTSIISLSENSQLVKSMKTLSDNKYFVNHEDYYYDPIKSVSLKYVFNDEVFSTTFKVLMSGVVHSILMSSINQDVHDDLFPNIKDLMILYNTRLTYKKDELDTFTKMLTNSLEKYETLIDVAQEQEGDLSFSKKDIEKFKTCQTECEKLLFILKNEDIEADDEGLLNFNDELDDFLKNHHDR